MIPDNFLTFFSTHVPNQPPQPPIESESNLVHQPRHARIVGHQQRRIGVCLYLTEADLCAIGIDVSNAELIEYSIDTEAEQLVVGPAIGD